MTNAARAPARLFRFLDGWDKWVQQPVTSKTTELPHTSMRSGHLSFVIGHSSFGGSRHPTTLLRAFGGYGGQAALPHYRTTQLPHSEEMGLILYFHYMGILG